MHRDENELRVKVKNHVRDNLPSGKQSNRRESFGCFYSRVTGIWQPVWLERVPEEYLESVKFYPDAADGSVKVKVRAKGCGEASVTVFYQDEPAGFAKGEVDSEKTFAIPLSVKRLWEPGHGRLYDVVIRFKDEEIIYGEQ